jgi:nitrous oxide reductase accessory protein NosL
MKTKLITILIMMAFLAGCIKEDEPTPKSKAKWNIVYRDTTGGSNG